MGRVAVRCESGPNSEAVCAGSRRGHGKVRTEILVNQKSTAQALLRIRRLACVGTLYVRDKGRPAVCDSQRSMEAEWRFANRVHRLRTASTTRIYGERCHGRAGLAAVRDYIAYSKQRASEGRSARISQSGRFRWTFIADGFNADEQGKKVLMAAHVAGGGNGDFNQRFAQPSHQRTVQWRIPDGSAIQSG